MLQDHINRIQAELKKRGIDCMALIPGYNLRYVTGLEFHLMERAVILFIPSDGAPVFALPMLEQAKAEGVKISSFAYPDGHDASEAVCEAVQALPEIHTIAVENLRMRVHELQLVQRQAPNAIYVDAGPVMDVLRLCKSTDEIARMRRAVQISEQALQKVLNGLTPGMTEAQVASQLCIAMLELGGEVLPFEPAVLTGARAALPHGAPGEDKLREGEGLLFDFGTSHGGYISDITRTVVVGKEPSQRFKDVYEAVKGANAAGRAAAGPGVPCQEVDRAARKVIDEAGFGEYFIHRVGHGIGMEGHEGPYMVEGNDLKLEVGMCFTVEPGLYIPGEVGVRIEDNLVITPDGAESLTTFGRDLLIAGR